MGAWEDFKRGASVNFNNLNQDDGWEVRVTKSSDFAGGWRAALYHNGRCVQRKFLATLTQEGAAQWGKRQLQRHRRAQKITRQSGRIVR
jgi:hypothetical protein